MDSTDEIRKEIDSEIGWTPVSPSWLKELAWIFSISEEGPMKKFRFLLFQVEGNWFISSIHPNVDDDYGHQNHVYKVVVNSNTVPVVDGGIPLIDTESVRRSATRWAMQYLAKSEANRNERFQNG